MSEKRPVVIAEVFRDGVPAATIAAADLDMDCRTCGTIDHDEEYFGCPNGGGGDDVRGDE